MRTGSLGIIVTYLCNIRCRHCCFACGPLKAEADAFLTSVNEQPFAGAEHALPADDVRAWIREAAACHPFREVVFSGGEPMLCPDVLVAGIETATALGLNTRIVTNGSWARNPASGSRTLMRLCDAGLREITISHTDFHREFVPFDTMLRACRLSRVVGLRIALSVTTNDESLVTVASLKQELASQGEDVSQITFFENDAISTGRGKDLALPSSSASRGLSGGGCRAAGTQPVITPDRKVFACCGPPHRELDLLRMGDLAHESLTTILDRMRSNPVIRALYDIGPEALHRKLDPGLGDRRMHICHHCKFVLTDHRAELLAFLREPAHAS
jgi:organic radical activating enzyme